MDLLTKREQELSLIYKIAGRGFFCLYIAGFCWSFFLKGNTPYFRDIMKHTILCIGGTFGSALFSERIAAELYYNRLLI